MTLHFRYPYWAENGMEMLVNGKKIDINQSNGSYVTMNRIWGNGDKIQINLPFSFRLESMPDNKSKAAVLYGPLVMAGELGSENHKVSRGDFFVPVMISQDKNIADWMIPDETPLTFRTIDAAKPADITFYPFYKMHNKRYSIYWDFMTEGQYALLKNDYDTESEQLKIYAAKSIDYVQPGDTISEKEHNYEGEISYSGDASDLTYRYASRNGWFSYDLAVNSDSPLTLLCTYWGGDSGKRNFDILIDETILATQALNYNKPGRFIDVEYKIPEELLKDKNKITVKFVPKPENLAGGVFGVRLIKE